VEDEGRERRGRDVEMGRQKGRKGPVKTVKPRVASLPLDVRSRQPV